MRAAALTKGRENRMIRAPGNPDRYGESILANSPQARKRARQAAKRRVQNHSQRATMRTYIKKVLKAVAAGDREAAQAAYQAAVPVIDRMAGKGLIHKNKAARHKSRLNARIRAL